MKVRIQLEPTAKTICPQMLLWLGNPNNIALAVANICAGRSKPSTGASRLSKRPAPMSSARRAISPRKSIPSNELANSM